MTHPACLVAGLGNSLMGDDGIGPAVIAKLAERALPSNLRIVDVGSDVSRLASWWAGESHVWLVDAVDLEGAPGTIHHIGREVLLHAQGRARSVHRLEVAEQLRWLAHGRSEVAEARFMLWGAVPESVTLRPTLSGPARAAVDRLAEEIPGAWQSRLGLLSERTFVRHSASVYLRLKPNTKR